MQNRFANWLERQWVRITPWHLLLLPLSWLFWLLFCIRRRCYEIGLLKSYRALVPVIVVGNITVGGTGKTPLVIALVEQLRQAGYSPGIISRGYGSDNSLPVAVTDKSQPSEVGDEPVLLAKRARCPVMVGRDRVAALQALLRLHPECNVVISDDGLQHYRLQRDIELVVVDAERGFGNGKLLPAGPLRESISRLKQVDAVIYNGNGEHASGFNMTLMATNIRNLRDPEMTTTAEALQGQKIHAIAGIGNPQRFFQQLRNMGLPVQMHAYPDHFAYQSEDLAFTEDDAVLMTEKDAVKCAGFAKTNWWYLPVDAIVDNALADHIVKKLRGE